MLLFVPFRLFAWHYGAAKRRKNATRKKDEITTGKKNEIKKSATRSAKIAGSCFAKRHYFVFSRGVISSFRCAITPGEKTKKKRNKEMAQTSHDN